MLLSRCLATASHARVHPTALAELRAAHLNLSSRPAHFTRLKPFVALQKSYASEPAIGEGEKAHRMPSPDPTKYIADVKLGQAEDVAQPLEKSGTGTEGAHPELPKVPADLSTPFHGEWLMGGHPVYDAEALDTVKVVRRPLVTRSDKVAGKLIQWLRKGFDIVSLYRHTPLPDRYQDYSVAQLRARGCAMSPEQWLQRILFLEVIAGIPGMVAGTLRHLHSLRLMKRDGGWIHTLLEEAENERMHLLCFLSLKKPGIFFRALILGAQGVFYNLFFLTYLLSPRVAHRFVGLLEEEAVITYTRCIFELDKGLIPEWLNSPAPEIAVSYWRMSKDAMMVDFIKNVRADEATHRFVNHTLASLDQRNDFNPFAIAEPDPKVKGTLPGFTREEAAEFARRSRDGLEAVQKEGEK